MGLSKTAYRVDCKAYEQFRQSITIGDDFIFSIEKGSISSDMPNSVIELMMNYLGLNDYKNLPLFGEQILRADEDLFMEYGLISIDFSGVETVKRIANTLNSITWERLNAYYLQQPNHLSIIWSNKGYERHFFNKLRGFYMAASINQQVIIAYSGF